MTRTALILGLTLAILAAPAPRVWADGLPLPVDESVGGVLAPNGHVRYLTAPTDRRTTVVGQDTRTLAVRTTLLLRGSFAVPQVGQDGTASGVSGDGHTLVLIRPRRGFPRASTTFAVLALRTVGLRPKRVVHLRGDFSFDALSPDGRSLFLIQYLSRTDPTKYRVRVYDIAKGRLAPKAIVDPRESPDEMNGYPMTRATGPAGRWAYTLYEGNGKPFIHALDTRDRRAVCIDLEAPGLRRDPYSLRLAVAEGGRRLDVLRRRRPVAAVDTRTFEVSEAQRPGGDGDGGGWTWGWGLAAIPLAAAGIAAGLMLRRRREPALLG